MDINKVNEIVSSLEKVRLSNELNIPDQVLFEQSIRIYISESIDNSKNRQKVFNQRTTTPRDNVSTELASEKQLDFLYKNNIDINGENLTKKQASEIIDKFIKNQQKG